MNVCGRLREREVERRRNLVAEVSDRHVADQTDDAHVVSAAHEHTLSDRILALRNTPTANARLTMATSGDVARRRRIEHPAAHQRGCRASWK